MANFSGPGQPPGLGTFLLTRFVGWLVGITVPTITRNDVTFLNGDIVPAPKTDVVRFKTLILEVPSTSPEKLAIKFVYTFRTPRIKSGSFSDTAVPAVAAGAITILFKSINSSFQYISFNEVKTNNIQLPAFDQRYTRCQIFKLNVAQ